MLFLVVLCLRVHFVALVPSPLLSFRIYLIFRSYSLLNGILFAKHAHTVRNDTGAVSGFFCCSLFCIIPSTRLLAVVLLRLKINSCSWMYMKLKMKYTCKNVWENIWKWLVCLYYICTFVSNVTRHQWPFTQWVGARSHCMENKNVTVHPKRKSGQKIGYSEIL